MEGRCLLSRRGRRPSLIRSLTSMEHDDSGFYGFATGMVVGALIGAGVALLMAPQTGKRTRKRIGRAADDLKESASDRWDEIAEDVREKVEDALTVARKKAW
jgi:gas vesicle protein